MKLNCWEAMGCGREPGGKNAEELGICPAAAEEHLDAIHGGRNAGRACWVVAGTLCSGEVHGTFAHKYKDCGICEFYQKVKREEEEAGTFVMTIILLKRLDGSPVKK